MMPYSGTCEQTKKMSNVTAVHSTFWLNGTYGNTILSTDTRVHETTSRPAYLAIW